MPIAKLREYFVVTCLIFLYSGVAFAERYEITQVSADDETSLESVAQMINEAYDQSYAAWLNHGFSHRNSASTFKAVLADKRDSLYVLIDNDHHHSIIGSILVKQGQPAEQYTTLGRYVVSAAYQGQKLGEKLLAFAEKLAFSHHPDTQILLEVFYKATKLQTYYAKHGYQIRTDTQGKPVYRLLDPLDQERAVNKEDAGKLAFIHMVKSNPKSETHQKSSESHETDHSSTEQKHPETKHPVSD